MSNDPTRVFPTEVLELQKQGVPLPTWFSGSLYRGNGTEEATKAIVEHREQANEPIVSRAPDTGTS
jgi:hypothetical protein